MLDDELAVLLRNFNYLRVVVVFGEGSRDEETLLR